jgi:hypothetical protein
MKAACRIMAFAIHKFSISFSHCLSTYEAMKRFGIVHRFVYTETQFDQKLEVMNIAQNRLNSGS